MSRRILRVSLVTTAVLIAAVVAACGDGSSARSADLAGDTVTTTRPATTTTAPTTTRPAPESTTTTAPPVRPAVVVPDPVQVVVPSIGVDAAVRPVGLAEDGTMAVPPPAEVGWYAPGATPGDAHGSAVLAGHVDFGGERGAFFELRTLEVGAEVTVVDARQGRHRFRVTERYQVGKGDLPMEQIFRRSGPAAVTLVTCGGAFNPSLRHYADNIVVVATPG